MIIAYKLLVGWIVWTAGAVLYAHLTTNYVAPNGLTGENMVEFVYASMAATYLLGIPVLTGIWVGADQS
jgi:hypothetical protein